ncbi:hypothetical protein IPZ61_15885 [Streptomyces sioyaensis]|uniref:hypothetical protein n=1 Tax=Streptomyces sioyaensis TaxID=67364 RepID=UPI001F2594DD|nr:hypothetical protein [Streptomyces sioyaensis]MCF3174799.1 hypothetical protein [Streptomyces sioyaensis]
MTQYDMTTAEGQLQAARARGLKIVHIKATGAVGWVTQERNYGYTLFVRIAGAKGDQAVQRVSVDAVEVE